jgi:AcrR family transcriptional regulator
MAITLDDLGPLPQEPEASRQVRAILRHALAHFARRGYEGTNVRAIAADAGMSAPMINYYFKTKEALHADVVAAVMATLDGLVWDDFPERSSFEAQAEHLLRAHATFARRHSDGLGLLLGLVYGPPEGRPGLDLSKLYQPTITGLRRTVERAAADGRLPLRPGIDPAVAVRALEDAVNRVAIRAWESPAADLDDLVGTALALLLDGVRERDP